ncbi:MAG: class I SAM-dependent methyltransferase [Draconibacterium sp.]|nr:class I SAM-dependent methyltransferase [Draconibacterium sp.]
MTKDAQNIQEEYYQQTAINYDSMHLIQGTDNEHDIALGFLSSFIKLYSIKSILDVGAGTGRTIEYVSKEHPDVRIVGIEPIRELREQGYNKGIPQSILIEGNGNKINFDNRSFDLVCEFGMLHHVPNPSKIISEMLRVADKCIFISDSNNFGQGKLLIRAIKQIINFFGLWQIYNFIRTKGKVYQVSDGDGLFYSYSFFNNYKQIKKECNKIHFLNTKDGSANLYRTASHVAVFAVKNL